MFLVGINLLREGLDIPEVTLVAILDADKEGFLRSETSLVQTIGRAARNAEGHVIMYGDTITQIPCVPPSQKQSGVVKFRWYIMKNMALRQRLFKRQFEMSFLLPMKKHQRRARG